MKFSIQMIQSNKKKILIIGTIFLLVVASFTGVATWILNDTAIFSNIFIEDVDVGGLSPKEASAKARDALKDRIYSLSVDIQYGDKNWTVTYDDLGVYYMLEDYIDKAYGIGRSGTYLERIKKVIALRKEPEVIELGPYFDRLKMEAIVADISNTLDRDAMDARMERKNGSFIIQKEELGIAVEKEDLKEHIVKAIEENWNQPIQVPVQYINPLVKEEDLKVIGPLIGEFSTAFNMEQTGRVENIKLAAQSIDGRVLMPGEEFSFNESTGPRSVEEGYQEALVIVNGEFVPGVGGGICQVSTTLYQAVVRSNIEITARRNHGLPVGYVPMGHDATVAYGYIDFKFKNNKDHPIYIESYVKDSKIYVKLYGKAAEDITIDLISETVEVIEPKMEIKKDPDMYVGETKISKASKKGYRVFTYKVYLQNGKEIKRELITKDYYPPRDGVMIEGTRQE